MAAGWLKRMVARYFGRDGDEALPLYNAVVLRARANRIGMSRARCPTRSMAGST
ncbi:hypothetical protein [Sphingomonas sp. SORGH_AS_0789]|uniref:hypothetical protein n=1 Tax=Sphingomonas sp. SORGH_AS_0789 TaxID=3041799 RepID=UPI00285BD5F4|nr:hypothetical protein [Sphingomonas sp. SORGH_AS_0789]